MSPDGLARLVLTRAVLEAGLLGPLAGAAVFVVLTFLKQALGAGLTDRMRAAQDAAAVLREAAMVVPAVALVAAATAGLLIHKVFYALRYRRGLPYALAGLVLGVLAAWPFLSELLLAGTLGEFLGDTRAEAILATGLAAGVLFWRRRRPDLDPF